MKIAITGGIGCGKSTVLEFLEANGIACFSADAFVRHLLLEDQSVINSVIEHFGMEFINEAGSVDRKALAKIVFQSKSDLEFLESLLHPLVQTSCEAFLKAHIAQLVCVEIPLLFEKRLEKGYDLFVSVICSDASANVRLKLKGYSLLASQVRDHRSPESLEYLAKIRGIQSHLNYAEAFQIIRWVD